MRITREDYKAYLKEFHRYGVVEGLTNIFIQRHEGDISKAFKETNIKAIELDD